MEDGDHAMMVDLAGAGDATMEEMASASASATTTEDEIRDLERALALNPVAEKLLEFLNFEDMKALSAVSKRCLETVRKTMAFSDKAHFIVSKSVVASGFLKDCVYLWKHVTLDLALPVEIVDLISDILESAHTLSLRRPESKDNKALVDYLLQIFKCTSNLEILRMDAAIMNFILHDVFSDVGVQTLLSRLKGLEIIGHCDRPNSICFIDGMEEDGDGPFQRNFLQLSMISLHLKRFVFGKIMPFTGSDSEIAKFIPEIIKATKDTLEELELHLNVWKYDEMNAILCPKLKSLILSADGQANDGQIVKTFLTNQPPLQELVISLNNEFPYAILQVLQGKCSKMKKLHIKTKAFSGTTNPVDWSFLETMRELKDFHIRKPTSSVDMHYQVYGHGDEILAKLPSGVKKLSLQGFVPFWNNETGNIGAMTARFENLKELNLLRSQNAVTDEGLQSLITNCKTLTSLTFSHCDYLTDFGLSGVRKREDNPGEEEKVGVSLRDLKGLAHLKIRSCGSVYSNCILKEVAFENLRSFDYYRNQNVEKSFLMQIAKQNPSLEKIALHIITYDSDHDFFDKLIREVKEIRPRLHSIEILENTDWQAEDSDSDASQLSDDSVSGGGYRRDDDDFLDYDDDYNDSPDYFDDGDDDYDEEDF